MKNRNIRLTISYDGTDFCGWQIQKKGRTIQYVLEEALMEMHKHPVKSIASGRTDSGVHASGQVVNFISDIDSISGYKYMNALNSLLPPDIRIMDSCEVPAEFHARFDAKVRIYKYFMYHAIVCPVHYSRFCYSFQRKPDMNLLNRYAADLTGIHDFSTFTAAGDSSKTRVREIFSAIFYREGPFLVFKIAGNAFLRRMVRSIAGTILELEENNAPEETMENAGTTAPAKGLFLHRVVYDTNTIY